MSLKLKFLILSVAVLFPGGQSFAQTSSFSFEMPEGAVTSLVQEQKAGHIWIGTSHGLSIYNGSYYRNIYSSGTEGRLDNDDILCLMSDAEGRIWVGNEGGIGYYLDGVYFHKNEVAINPVNKILDMGGSVVAMGKSGFVKFSKQGIGFEALYSEPGLSWIENMTASNGEVWFTTENDDSTFLKVLDSDLHLVYRKYIGNCHVRGICEGEPDKVWIATDDGLLNFEARSKTQIPIPKAFKDVASKGKILILCKYKESSLLVGIAGDGLYSLNTRTGLAVTAIPGLHLDGAYYKCLVDKDFNIWIASKEDGLKVWLDGNQPRNFSSFMPSGADKVTDLYFDKDGGMWLRIDDRIVSVDPATGRVKYELPGSNYTDMMVDLYGRLWAIQGNRKLERYLITSQGAGHTGEWAFDTGIFSVSEAFDGSTWLAADWKLIRIGADDNVKEYPVDKRMPFTFITNDKDGQIFMFTVKDGIQTVSPEGKLSRLGDSTVTDISAVFRSKDGTYWLGAFNSGLIRYDSSTGEKSTVGIGNGLAVGDIRSMEEDRKGNIWFSCSGHISKYDPSSKTVTSYHDNAYSEGGRYTRGVSASGPDGKIYFGGTNGVTVIDPVKIGPPSAPAPIFMEEVQVNGKQMPRSMKSLRLNHKENDVSFRFASLDFENGSMLGYSYMLKGFDKDWRYSATGVPAVYAHIPPGRYEFLARVRTENGQWSDVQLSMPVRIRPSVWGTATAKIIYILIFLWLAWEAYSTRVTVLRQRAALENSKQRIMDMEADKARGEKKPGDVPSGFLTEADAKFLARVQDCMDKNMSDPEFSMKALAEDVFMSYSSLYSKMKTLTGKTPQIYFADFRMEKAMEMLTIKGLSISEVSDNVGFSSSSAFSREFKNHYGIPPSKAKADYSK